MVGNDAVVVVEVNVMVGVEVVWTVVWLQPVINNMVKTTNNDMAGNQYFIFIFSHPNRVYITFKANTDRIITAQTLSSDD